MMSIFHVITRCTNTEYMRPVVCAACSYRPVGRSIDRSRGKAMSYVRCARSQSCGDIDPTVHPHHTGTEHVRPEPAIARHLSGRWATEPPPRDPRDSEATTAHVRLPRRAQPARVEPTAVESEPRLSRSPAVHHCILFTKAKLYY